MRIGRMTKKNILKHFSTELKLDSDGVITNSDGVITKQYCHGGFRGGTQKSF